MEKGKWTQYANNVASLHTHISPTPARVFQIQTGIARLPCEPRNSHAPEKEA